MTIPATNAVVAPDFTSTVNQEFFIEPHGGPKNPKSYLEKFPESLYTHDINSNLSALLYGLLGPAGIGWLRQNHLLARLEIEAMGLSTINLDELYANPFSFARLAEESYDFIPQGLLTNEQWQTIQTSDASYRNRAIDFLKAIKAGGTHLGIQLAARSGLNRPVEIIENYRAMYDRHSDRPLGLTFYGATESTEEIIVLPRQNVPISAQQTLTFSGNPIAGTFTIQVPIGSSINSTTSTIPYNATFDVIQAKLEVLPVVGHNVIVRGGPAPNAPLVISFTKDLADRPMPELIVVTQPTMKNIEGELSIPAVEVNQVGTSADGEEAGISSQDWFYATKAIDEIKPMTTILTPGKASGTTKRQVSNLEHSDSTFTEVLRYVTGLNSVKWPPINSTHWIEGGLENEAPVPQYAQQHHYSNFHRINSAFAYTDEALVDPKYGTSEWPTVSHLYSSEHTGTFSTYEQALMPFLAEYTDPTLKFEALFSVADPPQPLTIQSVTAGEVTTNFIENIYPSDYQGLPGVHQAPATSNFWASLERTSGKDFIEIDLGSVQAVNYISFQATNKPFEITVDYDILDMAPARRFTPVTLINQKIVSSTTSLGYDVAALNPWKSCTLYFTNSLGSLIFTRFIRIGFTRRPGFPYIGENKTPLAYSVATKNLRIGRNLS